MWNGGAMLLILLLNLVIHIAESTSKLNGTKPNVLFIVVDDLGWDDVGFRSHQINTPNIDVLASSGVVLNQYYVQDVCSPSRATFMTGRYAMHHSIVDWIPPASAYGLPLNETTMAEKFKSVGYRTHMSGKWHLGFFKWEMTPTFRGFDSFVGFYGGGEDYFTHQSSGAYDFRRDPEPRCGKNCSHIASADKGVYSTTIFTTEAVRVIQSHDTKDPLFLYLAYQGVHAPADVPQSYVDPYNETIKDPKRRTFAGMLSAVDEGIGNVTGALKDRGIFENTLIIFTSDNGGPIQGGDSVGARNWPYRGGKHSIWEGGVKATAFVTGHGIQEKMRGTDHQFLMHGADWLPTLGSVAGYDLEGTLPLDGKSHWKSISAGDKKTPRSNVVLGNSTNLCTWGPTQKDLDNDGQAANNEGCGFGIRDLRWKLIQGYGGAPDGWCNTTEKGESCRKVNERDGSTECPGGWCLFDLSKDPLELNEVSGENPQVLERMKAGMSTVLQTYTEYREDKSCPPVTYVQDPVVGKSWEPWC